MHFGVDGFCERFDPAHDHGEGWAEPGQLDALHNAGHTHHLQQHVLVAAVCILKHSHHAALGETLHPRHESLDVWHKHARVACELGTAGSERSGDRHVLPHKPLCACCGRARWEWRVKLTGAWQAHKLWAVPEQLLHEGEQAGKVEPADAGAYGVKVAQVTEI